MAIMRASETVSAKQTLERAGEAPDEAIDLAETALALAALERPRVGLDWYRRHLADLSEACAREAGEGVGGLGRAIGGVYGYHGDVQTYEDLQNANLMRVIDRRKGLPVALGILYLHAARAQGWSAAGLNFPGHFLIRVDTGAERAILDPFHEGHLCDPASLRGLLKTLAGNDAELRPEHYQPVGDREILLRLQNNIKLRLLQADQAERATDVIGTMLTLAPGHAGLWREAGLIHAHLGNVRAAVGALERVIDLADDDTVLHEAAVLLQQLKANLH
jgi:regulator of sirC expression with transglutaminase-like and TPR domain